MDYKALSFKCGIELHAQLEGKKLFCNCPALVNDESPAVIKFTRKLRTTVSELGAKDIAAEFEMKKDKMFHYGATPNSSCLVEQDESPPHKPNHNHIETALQVCVLLNAKPVDEIQFMRKIVIDGSNVSGFQRTALIATDGYIQTSKGKVSIETICLEEEAAKKIMQTDFTTTYRLDRQGVALIEIATAPDIKDSEHAKEVAQILGMILRSTGKAKRGLGSIRQDINVSTKNHPRIEIKGFQDLKAIPKTIENEIKRQLSIKSSTKSKSLSKEFFSPSTNRGEKNLAKPQIETRDSHVRKAEPDFTTTYLRPMPGTARMYPETDIEKILITKKLLDSIEIPELITERSVNLEKKYSLTPELARQIIKQNIPFEYYAENFKLNPKLIAQIMVEYPKDIKKRHKIKTKTLKTQRVLGHQKPERFFSVTKTQYELLFSNLEKQDIPKEAIFEILINFSKNKTPDFKKYTVDKSEFEREIKQIIEKNKGASFNAVMGEIMKHFKGKIDGKIAAQLLKKYL